MRNEFRAALPDARWGARATNAVAVLLADLAEWSHWAFEAGMLLDAAQSGRVRRRRAALQRERLQIAYALHRLALGEAMQQDADQVPLGRDELGKPVLDSGGWHTSLSHADGLVAIAVAARGPIGVDIECMDRAPGMLELAGVVCHPREAGLADGNPGEAARRLLRLWVRKEALLKAAGTGLARPMSDFAAPADEALSLAGGEPATTRVHMLDAGDGCAAAVAAPVGVEVCCGWLRPGGASRTWGSRSRVEATGYADGILLLD